MIDFTKDPVVSVFVSDWLRDTHTADGQPVIVADWYVTFETKSGRRFDHSKRFAGGTGWKTHTDECGTSYSYEAVWNGNKDEAERLASRVSARLLSSPAGLPDMTHWIEADPCYGSAAYGELDDAGFFRAREMAEQE